MAAYDPNEGIHLSSPNGRLSSAEANSPSEHPLLDCRFASFPPKSPIPYPFYFYVERTITYDNVPYCQSHWHQAESIPPTHDHLYDADDLNGSYHFDSPYDIAARNDHVSSYEAAYTGGSLGDADPTLPPQNMAIVPTVGYSSSASFPVPANGDFYDTPPYTASGMSFPSPRTPPQAQGLTDPRVTHHGHGLRCLWGTPACGQTLSDGSSATVRAHLREAHGIGHGTGGPDAKRATVRCLWGECSEHILVSGMGKHVATCHLKTTRIPCPSCGRVCSRQDALRRHADLYCPAARQAGAHSDRRGEPTGLWS